MIKLMPKTITLNATKTLSASALLLTTLLMTGAKAMLPTPADAAPVTMNRATATNTTTNNGINTQITAYVVSKNSAGAEQLMPVTSNTQINRGDVIEYRTQVTNTHNEQISTMKVTVGVPPQVKVMGNISPMLDEASVDGTSYHSAPIRGRIGGQIQAIPVSYYKGLRWNVSDLGVNKSTNLIYRAQVR